MTEGTVRRLKHLVVAWCFVLGFVAPTAAFAGPTVVSLSFDDGLSNQYAVRTMLSQQSLHATFYINSDNVGSSATYMSWSQLSDLASDSNEIGGHTLDHVDLTGVSLDVAQTQVCNDRQALLAHGFTVTDFAYPYGAENSTLYPILQHCGYSSGRRSWGLCAIGTLATNCSDPVAETVPPRNIWATATIPSVRSWNTLADLESVVTRAAGAGGGWVTLVFHNVCDNDCAGNGYSTSPSDLSAFLGWLAQQSAAGVYVRTVRDVVSDTTPPSSSAACNNGACSSGWYAAPVSISLSATDAGTAVTAIRYTTDGSDPTASSTLYNGPFSIGSTTTVKYRAWDMAGNVEATKSQLIQIDTTPPSSTIACNAAVCSSNTYGSSVTVSLSASDTGSGVAAIRYTTDGSDPTAASTLYTVSFKVASTTTVKYRAWDAAGNVEPTNSQLIRVTTADTTAPTSTIACNGAACTSGWYTAPVTVSLSATDPDDSVSAIRYTTDGSDPTTSNTLYNGPFSIGSTTTVKYSAVDSNGNVEQAKTQLIQIDTFPPTVSITSPSSGATLTGNVKIVASAADAQTGVASVGFYVDDSLVGTTTSSPWQVPWNTKKSTKGSHVLKAVATDRAGNKQTSATVTVTVR